MWRGGEGGSRGSPGEGRGLGRGLWLIAAVMLISTEMNNQLLVQTPQTQRASCSDLGLVLGGCGFWAVMGLLWVSVHGP